MPNNFKQNKRIGGFTLLESIIYISLISLLTTLIIDFAQVSFKSYQKIQVENELSSQLIRLEEIFRQKIGNAKKITSISASLITLEPYDPLLNPTTFTLYNNILFLSEGNNTYNLNDKNKIKITGFSIQSASPSSAIKITLTLQYNSPKPELSVSKSKTFVVHILNPQ